MLPAQKVMEVLDLVIIFRKDLFSRRAASKGPIFPLDRQKDRSLVCFNVNGAKVWNAKNSHDNLIRHLVDSPCYHLVMSTRKDHTSQDVLPTLSRQDPTKAGGVTVRRLSLSCLQSLVLTAWV